MPDGTNETGRSSACHRPAPAGQKALDHIGVARLRLACDTVDDALAGAFPRRWSRCTRSSDGPKFGAARSRKVPVDEQN